MTTIATRLPTPSKDHATCAWCGARLRDVVELIDHVDASHVASAVGGAPARLAA